MKKSLAYYCRKIAHEHLVMGAMGNISAREKSGCIWIKKSGAWMEKARPADFIRVWHGPVSKEINLHLGCYKARPEINAVIHTHPFVITAVGTVLAGKKRLLRGVYPERSRGAHNDKGTAIIKYYKPGSIALARAVSKAIKKANSVVMANHGLVVVGRSLKEAYARTSKIEANAGKLLKRMF